MNRMLLAYAIAVTVGCDHASTTTAPVLDSGTDSLAPSSLEQTCLRICDARDRQRDIDRERAELVAKRDELQAEVDRLKRVTIAHSKWPRKELRDELCPKDDFYLEHQALCEAAR